MPDTNEGEKMMTDIAQYMKQRLLIDEINDYLQNRCGFDYAFHAEKQRTKPELVFQGDLRDLLGDNYKVENPYPINTAKLVVRPTLNELQWEIDLKVSNDDVLCYIEMKYDELNDDGSSTNPRSEEEILRDLYKLQCIKQTFPNALCLIIFATNNPTHWENFTYIEADEYTISYNEQDETFKILHSYRLSWQDTFLLEEEGYKYFVLEL